MSVRMLVEGPATRVALCAVVLYATGAPNAMGKCFDTLVAQGGKTAARMLARDLELPSLEAIATAPQPDGATLQFEDVLGGRYGRLRSADDLDAAVKGAIEAMAIEDALDIGIAMAKARQGRVPDSCSDECKATVRFLQRLKKGKPSADEKWIDTYHLDDKATQGDVNIIHRLVDKVCGSKGIPASVCLSTELEDTEVTFSCGSFGIGLSPASGIRLKAGWNGQIY